MKQKYYFILVSSIAYGISSLESTEAKSVFENLLVQFTAYRISALANILMQNEYTKILNIDIIIMIILLNIKKTLLSIIFYILFIRNNFIAE